MFFLAATAVGAERPWMNPALPESERVELLLSAMTLEEKIDQLNQPHCGQNDNLNNIATSADGLKFRPPGSYVCFLSRPELRNGLQRDAIEHTRLGIPIIFGFDVIHGCKTIFPVPLAQGASFNPALTKETSAIAAKEARLTGIDWTFSPMIDIANDPRWGRIVEGYGEDPYLTAVFGVAAVQGYQGDDPAITLKRPDTVAACLKHFVAYGASEGGRDYHYTSVPRNELFDTYLPPYEAAVKAGAATVMSAFNDLSGAPTSANRFLETDLLRGRWGFDGFVVSDWVSVGQLVNQGNAANGKHAAELALNAGTDMDMIDKLYLQHLSALIAEGRVSQATLDEAVRRVLRIKFRCGLFETPYAPIVPENERYFTPEAIDAARRCAVESFVLLENKNSTLPLSPERTKKILLIGPAADSKREMLGSWIAHADISRTVTLKAALERHYAVTYIKGFDYKQKTEPDFAAISAAAQGVDVVIACLGETFDWSGENRSRGGLFLPGGQNELMQELKKTGKPIVSLLFTGRPLEIETVKACSDALMVAWFPGSEAGNALVDVLFGKESPSGKLTASWPRSVGQVPVHYRRRPPSRKSPIGDYVDMPTTPSYTFGDGMTYTTFSYSNLTVSATDVRRETRVSATIDVTNTGKVAAKEAVLWFINDPAATVTRPRKELKHFSKAEIQPGETQTFTFEFIAGEVFSYPDATGARIFEPGAIHLMAGNQKITLNCL